jgi:hypothetical protein
VPYFYKRITHRPTDYRNKAEEEEFPSKREKKKKKNQ